jgi:hypothetical protein
MQLLFYCFSPPERSEGISCLKKRLIIRTPPTVSKPGCEKDPDMKNLLFWAQIDWDFPTSFSVGSLQSYETVLAQKGQKACRDTDQNSDTSSKWYFADLREAGVPGQYREQLRRLIGVGGMMER